MSRKAALLALCLLLLAPAAPSQTPDSSTQPSKTDGAHDWDTFFGTWKLHLRRRLHPLANSNEWADFEAHSNTRRVWGGKANLDEFEADGPAGHIEGLTLRLYNPQTQQWSIWWANATAPDLGNPTIGGYRAGRGEFYDQEFFHDRAIYVRYIWSNVSDDSGDFEQSFSADGGKSWEPNWVTTMSREASGHANVPPNPDRHDGQHDFDFEFGSWKTHIRRLVHPLSGSNEWQEYDGTSVVTPFWNGRGNLGELNVHGPATLEGLSLRLFDPKSHQWSIYWANASDGQLATTPMVGGFRDGKGEFHDREKFNGRWIQVRFLFTGITKTSFQLEQSFSDDFGRTWEANWIAQFTRQAQP